MSAYERDDVEPREPDYEYLDFCQHGRLVASTLPDWLPTEVCPECSGDE